MQFCHFSHTAADALHIVKAKYQMDTRIEVMINCWIRGLQDIRRSSRSYMDIIHRSPCLSCTSGHYSNINCVIRRHGYEAASHEAIAFGILGAEARVFKTLEARDVKMLEAEARVVFQNVSKFH